MQKIQSDIDGLEIKLETVEALFWSSLANATNYDLELEAEISSPQTNIMFQELDFLSIIMPRTCLLAIAFFGIGSIKSAD